jgi:hypothetical protein
METNHLEQNDNIISNTVSKRNKYTKCKFMDILDVSFLENPLCYIILIHNHEKKKCPKIESITKKRGISYLNKERIGSFLTSFISNNNSHNIYTNYTPNKQIEPEQIIFLPKKEIDFHIYIKCLKIEISAKRLYKHISRVYINGN